MPNVMSIGFPLIIAIGLASGSSPPAPPQPALLDQPAYEAPARPWSDVAEAERDLRCRDRIEQVRESASKPKLGRSPARSEKPDVIYAVDHRIEGCTVLMPASDPADIRPVPKPNARQAELIPATP